MSTTGIILTVVVIAIALSVAATWGWGVLRRRRLRRRFGSEYDRALDEQPNRSAAEHELRGREQRHDELDLTPLSSQDQRRYLQEWTRLQAAFVEDPSGAVSAADALLNRVMSDRGYPTGDFDDRVQTLSVEHARTLEHYRRAHDISLANLRGQASTEQLRQAVMQYRALLSEPLDVDDLTPRRIARDHPNDAREVR